MAKDDDILSEAKEAFEECESHDDENRTAALDDLEFARLGQQWHSQDEGQRRKDGRPCLTINRMPAFIRQVVNDARQNTPAIDVRPVDGKADVETASIMSDLIRDIEAQSDADTAYDTAVDFAVTCGFGYFRINTEYACDDSFEQDIRIQRVSNPFSIYGDPNSDSADSADWNISFVIDKMKRDVFEKKYKGADPVPFSDPRWDKLQDPWKDGDNIAVAEYWTRTQIRKPIIALSSGDVVSVKDYERNKELFDAQGIAVIGSPRDVMSYEVTQRLMTGVEVLEETKWPGKYIPIVPVYGEDINVAGKRYLRSLIRDAKDPQRMFNYWRTASTELVALAPKAPFIGPEGAFKSDAAKWATANRASHAFIEYDGQVPPQRQPMPATPVGAIQEALNASDDMKAIMGLFDASLGARSNETSGRAINARKIEGDVSTFHFIDNLSRAIRHGGRILIDLIPKVYSTPRIIRVLGQDKEARNVPINQPFQTTNEQGQQISKIYDLSVGRYDLVVKAGPSFTTRREEAATQMMELIRAYPQAAPVIGDLLVEALDWPGASEIAERLKKLLPPQLQGQPGQPGQGVPPQVLQQAQQVVAQLKAQLGQAQQEIASLKADKTIESMKVKIDAYEAETHRLKAMGPGQMPVSQFGQQTPSGLA